MSQDSVMYRPAQPEDWPRVAGLLGEAGLPLDGAQPRLTQFELAEAAGQLVGVAGHERYGDAALLRSFAVAADWRGAGLGSRLLARQRARLRQAGVSAVYLLTTTAQDWFAAHGFDPAPRDALPAALFESAELRGACPASAQAMWAPTAPEVSVREATEADQDAIREIYNHAVRTSVASFDEAERSAPEQLAWWRERGAADLPVFVAVDPVGQVLGWSALGRFRPRAAYRFTGEHSVYVAPAARGQGVGAPLLRAVCDAARQRGWHTLVAVIALPNAASVALHAAHDFEPAGRLREVGHKFGHWVDLQLMQCWLNAAPAA